jgi:serine/threonine protein kinase
VCRIGSQQLMKSWSALTYIYIYCVPLCTFWLTGNRGGGRAPLDWVARARIALGAAKGIEYLHQAGSAQRLAHGNIKSSNVLLNQDLEAGVSDFGLVQLVGTTPALGSRINSGYTAPEVLETRKTTFKSDVYSFGVVCVMCFHSPLKLLRVP